MLCGGRRVFLACRAEHAQEGQGAEQDGDDGGRNALPRQLAEHVKKRRAIQRDAGQTALIHHARAVAP
eukprot:4021241-Pyramimonas_sp.AAC.1